MNNEKSRAVEAAWRFVDVSQYDEALRSVRLTPDEADPEVALLAGLVYAAPDYKGRNDELALKYLGIAASARSFNYKASRVPWRARMRNTEWRRYTMKGAAWMSRCRCSRRPRGRVSQTHHLQCIRTAEKLEMQIGCAHIWSAPRSSNDIRWPVAIWDRSRCEAGTGGVKLVRAFLCGRRIFLPLFDTLDEIHLTRAEPVDKAQAYPDASEAANESPSEVSEGQGTSGAAPDADAPSE